MEKALEARESAAIEALRGELAIMRTALSAIIRHLPLTARDDVMEQLIMMLHSGSLTGLAKVAGEITVERFIRELAAAKPLRRSE